MFSTARAALVLCLIFAAGCYDVVPAESRFGGAAADAAGADTAGGAGDTNASDTASDAATDTASDTASDAGELADTASGKACQSDDDCDKAKFGCSFFQCVKGFCQTQVKKDGETCDDNDLCTSDSTCTAGACGGGNLVVCDCLKDADCAKKSAGNKCLAYYCDTSIEKHTCKVNPASVVTCPSPEEGGCVASIACAEGTGECEATHKPNFGPDAACDDGDFCTAKDYCKDGTCYPGKTANCACTQDADCAAKDSPCGGQYYCDVLAESPNCQVIPGTKVSCDSSANTACVANTCDAKTGACALSPTNEDKACDDSDPCTEPGKCKGGKCNVGVSKCECTADADCAKFEDGDPCNGTYYCAKSDGSSTCQVNPATKVTCPSNADTVCAKNTCDPQTGKCALKPADKLSPCNADGDPCTQSDFCDGKGSCVAGTNTCGCDPSDATACKDKDDGDPCNGTVYCDPASGTCKNNPGTEVVCAADGNPCTKDACDKKTGKCVKTNLSEKTPCNDDLGCNQAYCLEGKCEVSVGLCTCTKDSDCKDKEDGNACNGTLFCDKSGALGECKVNPATVVTCGGGAAGCSVPVCNPETGQCSQTPDSSGCDDKKPCTVDVCNGKTNQCAYLPVAEGTACGAGKQCSAGACVAQPAGMVLVPGGKGWAGCSNTNFGACGPETLPAVEAEISGLWLDVHEVTVADYDAFLKQNPKAGAPGTSDAACNWAAKAKRQQHPVNCVTWKQADEYCKGKKKRLPTEAEWERGARGGCDQAKGACKAGTRVFPWGNNPPSCYWTVMQGKSAAGCEWGTTRAVGTYKKDQSPYGAYDMGGNVAEWVLDGWDPNGLSSWKGKDPKVPGGGTSNTVKGGHLAATPTGVRSFSRAAGKASATVGFRCALEL